MATNNMKEWMSRYPSLHTVSIVLKDLLKRRDLNNIYKGNQLINDRWNKFLQSHYSRHRLHASQENHRGEEPSYRILWFSGVFTHLV
jgi:hypothetical protein